MIKTKFAKTLHKKAKHRQLAVLEWRKTELIEDTATLKRVVCAWKKVRNTIGYTSYTEIYAETRIPYQRIFGAVKWLHHINPYAVICNVDRMGNNVYFSLIPKELPDWLK